MEFALQELQKRKDAEIKPKDRTMPDVADELLISDHDYFYPPMNDSSAELNGDDASSEQAADGGDLSTVDEISVEEDQASDDDNHF